MNKIIVLLITLIVSSLAHAEKPKSVYMTVWRGCEEACQGFFDYIKTNNLPVEVTL